MAICYPILLIDDLMLRQQDVLGNITEDRMLQTNNNHIADEDTIDMSWRGFFKIGGVAALLTILVGLLEIVITFLPGGNISTKTVLDWFALFQDYPFMGLRNLGLINIILVALSIPVNLALFGAHRKVNPGYAALAVIASFIGAAIFYGTNRAFPMLDLSNRYAAATTDAQRAMLAAAGQALLAVGESHTLGTFIAFFFSEISSILMGMVMLQGKVFSRATAIVGILAFGLLMIFDISISFMPALGSSALVFALPGGLLSMAWDILIARRLFQLAKGAI
jgi:hypothetical protein